MQIMDICMELRLEISEINFLDCFTVRNVKREKGRENFSLINSSSSWH